jgi:hypothetical protein
MQTYRARRVVRADRGGSSWPVLIDTERGVFYTKLRGAAQAPASLVAEIVVGRLADALSLSVPARVLIDVPADLQSDDPHEELAQLLRFSVGLNLGFAYLPDATDFHRADVPRVDPDLASKIAWLDGLVQNPDRTAKNPNLMWCRDRLWLIDHGASLGFHHRWSDVTEESPRTQAWSISHHVLRSQATKLAAIDTVLAGVLDRAVLESAVGAVPREYLSVNGADTHRRRAAYVAFLWKRLKEPRPFLSIQ